MCQKMLCFIHMLRAVKMQLNKYKRLTFKNESTEISLTSIYPPTQAGIKKKKHSQKPFIKKAVIRKVLCSTQNSRVGRGVSFSESLETAGQSNNMPRPLRSNRTYCCRRQQLRLGDLSSIHYLFLT